MKKAVIFFAVIIVSTSGFCQLSKLEGKETSDSKIRFGIKAGIAFANTKIEYNSTPPGNNKPQTKLGVMGGVFARLDLGKKTCFQPELLLVGKGMQQNDQYYPYRAGLTYLEVPFNLLYKPTASKGSFFIGGGPAPAYYIGQNVFYSGYNNVKKFDVGINILTGYELPVGLSINLNYTYGLLNISQNRTDVPVTKNRSFGLSVGYIF
ncbi:MAG: porin family protein [Chitinophagaceae bacterium]